VAADLGADRARSALEVRMITGGAGSARSLRATTKPSSVAGVASMTATSG